MISQDRRTKNVKNTMMKNALGFYLVIAVLCSLAACSKLKSSDEQVNSSAIWPQAAGPNHSWIGSGPQAPTSWSVARNQNILWRTPLPNGGQSGITVWKNHLFLTTFSKDAGDEKLLSAEIEGHCIDAKTGQILWTVALPGSVKSQMMSPYSDSTSPTPVTNGKLVVFSNASGTMAAFDFQGKKVWQREWTPWGEPFPFNKQHEPILYNGVIVNVEPQDGNPDETYGWNYLRGIDLQTGKTLWVAKDGTTSYATSVFGISADGRPAILTGRGGHHGVPERPIGLSLISLAPGEEGETIWRFAPKTGDNGLPLDQGGRLNSSHTWQVLWMLHWNKQQAYLFNLNPLESHVVIDATNGQELSKQSLIEGVDYRPWDVHNNRYSFYENINLRDITDWSVRTKDTENPYITVYPAWHNNIVIAGYHYFMTTTGHQRNREVQPNGRAGPSHSLGRINIDTGKTEYLELPVTVIRKLEQPDKFIYGVAVKTSTKNSQGQESAADPRSRSDGARNPVFWGSPTIINGVIYFTTMLGVTYAINADAPVLDASALIAVNDLGPSGETWSLNSLSYANGKIYHRSLKELVAIGTTTKE